MCIVYIKISYLNSVNYKFLVISYILYYSEYIRNIAIVGTIFYYFETVVREVIFSSISRKTSSGTWLEDRSLYILKKVLISIAELMSAMDWVVLRFPRPD